MRATSDTFTGDPVTYPSGILHAMANHHAGDYPTANLPTTTATVTKRADSYILPAAHRCNRCLSCRAWLPCSSAFATQGALIFCRPDGKHLEIWDLHDVLDYAARKAGLRRLRWYDLRHSYASNAVASGVPLNVVQAWMGHSTIGMTMRYAHLAPSASTEWIRALETPQRKPDANMAGMGV